MATKINSINNARLPIASHVQFHTEATDLIASATAAALHLDAIYPAYKAAVTAENEVVNRPTTYAETQRIAEADHVRDRTVSLIFNLTYAFAVSPLASQRGAAATVGAAIRPYHGIRDHELNRQTAEVDSMTAALGESAVRTALAILNIGYVTQELVRANDEFKAATAARDAEALRRQPVKEAVTRTLRACTDTQYRRAVEIVNAFAIVAPSAEMTDFIDRMNVLIDKYRFVIANQGKVKSAGDTGSGATKG